MNPENLIPNSERTPSERKKIATKGGIASGKARRRKRRMRELAEMAATLSAPKSGKDYYNDFFELEEDNVDNEMVFMAHLWEDANNGVESARRTLLRLLGEDDELNERIRSNKANEKLRNRELDIKEKEVEQRQSQPTENIDSEIVNNLLSLAAKGKTRGLGEND